MKTFLVLLALSLFVIKGWAGGGPSGFIVVYDARDIRSTTIANHYQNLRNIPERNMINFSFPSGFNRTSAWDFVYFIRETLAERGLEEQFQGIALAAVTPLGSSTTNGGTESNKWPTLSLQSFLYISPNYSHGSTPVDNSRLQKAFPSPTTAFNGPSPTGTRAINASSSFDGETYWPVSYIGFPGWDGNSPREILRLLDRSLAADGAKPNGTIYWPLNSDVRSYWFRQGQIQEVKNVWADRGIRFEVTGRHNQSGNTWVSNKPDVAGGLVGASTFSYTTNTYLPGAWVDNVTSVGGSLSGRGSQTPASMWLRSGAYGSSGAVVEPTANRPKFPHPHIHTHFRAGASLAEAFWQSIQRPAEIMALGDPLMQPYADFPVVEIAAPLDGASVSGLIHIVASAQGSAGKTLEPELDLFINGRRIAIGAAHEAVVASRQWDGFSLDTTSLPDGWHDVRVVAYNADSVRTEAEAGIYLEVDNFGQSIALSGPGLLNRNEAANFVITPSGLPDLDSLTLQANGRILKEVATGGGGRLS